MLWKFLTALASAAILAACVDGSADNIDDGKLAKERGAEALAACQASLCTRLDLDGMQLEDFAVLNDMPHVTILMASRTNLKTLNTISGMTQLKELHIAGTQLDSFDGLRAFSGLTLLHANYMPGGMDVTPVKSLTGLRELAIDVPQGDTLAYIANMRGLQTLFLGSGSAVDLGPLANHPSLSTFSADGVSISDGSALLQMPQLRDLTIDHFSVDQEIVDTLRGRGVNVDDVVMVVC